MIRAAHEARHIPIAAPKEITFRPVFIFIGSLCHHLNRYMDAVHKVHVSETDRRLSSDERPY